ncbi:MAG: hypothetical protein SOR40_05275 [Rothia sp. (in: high G+C Gram-positive bacteria)]|nr:hypothetical protein [Rothia sp. (in: high G+C Gram-positive bacteria)]
MTSTEPFSQHKFQTLAQAIQEVDAIVVGAGAGLSAADGYQYGGSWFSEHFGDFATTYGLTDAYSAGFYPFPTLEEKWGFWSRLIYLNRYDQQPGQTYRDLLSLLADKNYFVVTTNVDHCFQRAGFDKDRLYYMQGDFGLFQCSLPCHQGTYDNEETIRQMIKQQVGREVPSQLIPSCPRCGAPMDTNLRIDHRFVQDAGWEEASARYQNFIATHAGGRILYLELGVGANTPGIIKYPFWRLTEANPQALYAALGFEAQAPSQIADRSLLIPGDLARSLETLASELPYHRP